MQISNSMQSINNTLVYETKRAEEEQQQKELERQNSEKANGYNTTSKLYRELSEDMSKYSIANPTQDRIDEDVLNTLSKHQDGGLNDFFKFNSYMKFAFAAQSEEGRELAMKIGEQIENFFENKDNPERKNSLKPKDPMENITLIGEHFTHYNRANKEDMAILAEKERKGFQNTYRLSDEFAKTEKFNELFTEYKEEGRRLGKEALEKGDNFAWSYIFKNDFIEVEKAGIIKKGYSKSEWIESIDKSKTLLEDILKNNPNMMDKVKIEMKDNIKFYENILTDLKELWQYGDFKADG